MSVMTPNVVARSLAMPAGYGQTTGEALPWAFAEDRLVAAANYWLATTKSSGAPHVTPVWGVWVEGALWFDGIPTAAWARNAARNPAASVHLESGDQVVILEGVVEDIPAVENSSTASAIVDAWQAKYGRLVPDPANDGLFRFKVGRGRGWSSFPGDATRWDFEA
jgi:hypothetical protein